VPQVLHLSLNIGGSFMSYWPGDSIGVSPRNDPALVDFLLTRLRADGAAVFSVAPADNDDGGPDAAAGVERLLPHLKWPCTLREALSVRAPPHALHLATAVYSYSTGPAIASTLAQPNIC
jgi:sulfite reductase alpha subunit-like flavoprotein